MSTVRTYQYVIYDKKGVGTVLDRDCKLIIKDDNGRERFREKIPYGSNILLKEKSKIESEELMSSSGKFTLMGIELI